MSDYQRYRVLPPKKILVRSVPKVQHASIRMGSIANRNQFGRYCDRLGYRVAVEVGVDLGLFSAMLLSGSNLVKLYCVDPYLPYKECPQDRTTAKETVASTLGPFAGRYEMVELPSVVAAKRLSGWVDFVYVDGAHDAENVRTDLEAWWPKVRIGGTLAGHDFDYDDVRIEVIKFATDRKLTIYQVPANGDVNQRDENGGWAHPSFYMVKE